MIKFSQTFLQQSENAQAYSNNKLRQGTISLKSGNLLRHIQAFTSRPLKMIKKYSSVFKSLHHLLNNHRPHLKIKKNRK